MSKEEGEANIVSKFMTQFSSQDTLVKVLANDAINSKIMIVKQTPPL